MEQQKRYPEVAGFFYPEGIEEINKQLRIFLKSDKEVSGVLGAIVPHAGWSCSGVAAGKVFASIEKFDTYIVLGPNHHGSGKPISVYPSGEWILPNGKIEIDTEVVSALIKEAEILKPDASAHLQEHSIEVQIPFILTWSPKAKLVPISMYDYSKKSIKKLSEALFKIISKSQERILLVASSDMTHYEAPGFAREQDFKAIAKIEKLDLDGFLSVVDREEITMCGVGPVGVVMETSRLLGAKKGEVLIYTNSGETCSPGTEVVGYLGLVFK